MTHEERVANLKHLGYSDNEAAFLTLAALHGGYFLGRQYVRFLGTQRGKLSERFVERGLASRHLKPLSFRGDRVIYHTASKPLFRALGEENNRNRRTHEIPSVKTRLMGLDYVLQQPEQHFLATESERVNFFGSLGIEKYMPTRRYRSAHSAAFTDRHFIDKFPISWTASESAPLVSFVYVDAGAGAPAFELYIEQYRELMMRTLCYRMVYVSQFHDRCHHARTLFERAVTAEHDTIPATLIAHFEDRAAYERKDFSRFDQAKLIEYRGLLSRFSGARYDVLYERWRQAGMIESGPKPSGRGTFVTHVLPFTYALFGALPGTKPGEHANYGAGSPSRSPSRSPSCGSYVSGD